MEKFYNAWRNFRAKEQLKESHKNKLKKLQKDREVLNEVSREAANKIYDWMRDASVMDYSFDRLFDGKMRMAMPFDSEDALNLKKAVRTLKKDGWMAGEAPDSPEHRAVPQPALGHGVFPTRKVKQKRQRLADQGGGFYEEEIEVADLGLAKSYEKEIPAGPRKGEVIQRTDKLGMGKAIAKLVKEKKLDKELLDWWHQRQTYYTKDNNWKEIEQLFRGDEADYTVIISRHPIDVLRMSDIGNISSCHSEGASHWHCAKAEAKGHGPIAYLVPTSDYEKLVAGLYDEGLAADQTPAVMKNIDKVARREAQDYIERYFLKFNPRWGTIYRHRDNPEQVEFAIKAVEDEWSVKKAYEDLPTPAKAFLSDQVILDAVIAKAEKKDQPLTKAPEQKKEPEEPEELADISKFDDKEIFRDRNRGIKGIVAKSRLRFRKYEDGETGFQFLAPEHRTYGAPPPGFVNSMVKWAAESQEGALKDRDFLGSDEEGFAPDWYNITRYGGSYEDTTDDDVLGELFKYFDPEFGAYDGEGNVSSESDEEEDQAQEMWEEYEGRIDELNDQAANYLEHISCHASLEEGGGMGGDEPIIYASADMEIEIPLTGWNGLEPDTGDKFHRPLNYEFEGQPGTEVTMIPHSWNPGNYAARNSFESSLESALEHYSEETEWEVDIDGTRAASRRPEDRGKAQTGDVVLTVRFRFNCDDCNDPDDYENFIDYMADDLDKKYDEIKEKIRLELVEEEYIARNYFDSMLYPAGWDEELEEPTESPVETFAGDLKHFEYTAPDGDGEMTFMTSEGRGMYISSEMTFPAELSSRTGATGGPTFLDMQNVFGGDRHPHVYQTGVKHTGHGKQAIAQALSDLEAEARREGERQLAFEFGDEYKKEYSAILPDFAKDTEMYTINKSSPDGPHLAFGVQIVVRSVDSEREIKGAMAFVKHIDDNIDRFRKAFESLWKPAIDEAHERNRVAAEAAVSRDTADELLNALDRYSKTFEDVPPSDPGFNPRSAAAKALILWTNESWDEMNNFERRILISKFLKPILHGPVTADFSPGEGRLASTPSGWNRRIHDALREAGAGWNVINAYKWEGPDYGAIYSALTNPEGVEQEQPPQETRGGVRQGAPIAATMGEPVPAGGPIVRNARGERMFQPSADAEINEPPEDLREAIRNAINRTIYKKEPAKVSKNSNLKEAIRKALEESLYSQGGPEDLPSMGPGLAKRDDDEKKGGPKDSKKSDNSALRKAIHKAIEEGWATKALKPAVKKVGQALAAKGFIESGPENNPIQKGLEFVDAVTGYVPGPDALVSAAWPGETVSGEEERSQIVRNKDLGCTKPGDPGCPKDALKVSIKEAVLKALKEQRETIIPGMEEIAADNIVFQPSEATLEPAAQMGMQYDDPTPQEEAYLDFRKQYAKTPMYDPESGVAYQQRDWLDMGQLPGEPGWVDNTMPEDDRGRGPRRTMPTRGTPDEYMANVTADDAWMDPRYDRWMQQAGLRPGDPGFDVDNLYGPEEEIPENIYSAPVSNRRITSPRGYRKSPGIDASTLLPIPGRFHAGTDVGGRSGEPIYSTLPGRVLSSEYHGGYGWTVTLQHIDPRTGTPMATRDAHFLEKPNLKPGDWVEAGAEIGRMGSSGTSTGTHLHHEEYGLGGRLSNAADQAAAEAEIKKELSRRAYAKRRGIPYYPSPGMVGPGYDAARSWPTEWGQPARGEGPDYTELVGLDEPIEPGTYPELIKPPPFVDQRRTVREAKATDLKNAIREAIKIKVLQAPGPPPEEECELPTLQETYIQNVYEANCSLNIHKQRGGNRDQTLTDIRGIPGVTIVSVIPGTTRDLPHTFITGLSIKFELNKNLPPRNYVKTTLLPGMQKIPGVSNFQVKTIEQITSVEDEV